MDELETEIESKTNADQTQAHNASPIAASRKPGTPSSELSLRVFRAEAEVHAISNALKKTGWNRKRAARLLSISYRGLLYKIRRHNLAPPAAQS